MYMSGHKPITGGRCACTRKVAQARGGGAGKVGCTSAGAATPFAASGIFSLDDSSSRPVSLTTTRGTGHVETNYFCADVEAGLLLADSLHSATV